MIWPRINCQAICIAIRYFLRRKGKSSVKSETQFPAAPRTEALCAETHPHTQALGNIPVVISYQSDGWSLVLYSRAARDSPHQTPVGCPWSTAGPTPFGDTQKLHMELLFYFADLRSYHSSTERSGSFVPFFRQRGGIGPADTEALEGRTSEREL